MKKAFDSEKYLRIQKEIVSDLVANPSDVWCIEVGGKLIQDRHAARVLPGFDEDSRFEFVRDMSDSCDVIMVVSAKDIARRRIRGDFKISYDDETFRSIAELAERGLHISHIAISRMDDEIKSDVLVINFIERIKISGYTYSIHRDIEKYSLGEISEEDLEASEQIIRSKKKVLVISPGGGSGKFGICMNLLYQCMKQGLQPHYFSIGAFPLYDLAITHPLNLAYIAATADFSDTLVNDPDKENSVVTEREIQNFQLLKKLSCFFDVEGKHLREIHSASDMCVSLLSKGIIDDEEAQKEAAAEIARRYIRYKFELQRGEEKQETVDAVKSILDSL